jgi:hypothetical protein
VVAAGAARRGDAALMLVWAGARLVRPHRNTTARLVATMVFRAYVASRALCRIMSLLLS